MKYVINGVNKINDKVIDDKIFQKEKVDWVILEREDQIDHLIDWISEATDCREMMKDDLKYLISISNEYIISSILTNEYLTEDTKEGQLVLAEIYKMSINK